MNWLKNNVLEIGAWLIIIAGGAVVMLSERLSTATQNTIGVFFIVAGMYIFTPYFVSNARTWRFPNCLTNPYSPRCILLYILLTISVVAIGYEVCTFIYEKVF